MNDLISRSDVHNKICKHFNIPKDWDGDIAEPLQTVLDLIENQPTVDTESIRNDGYNQGGVDGIKKFAERLKANIKKEWNGTFGKYRAERLIDDLLKEMGV